MNSSLGVPDMPRWSHEAGYSPAAAVALARAYAHIRRPTTALEDLIGIRALVAPLFSRPMSERQRLQAHYALAWSHTAAGEFAEVAPHLDSALDLAVGLSDTPACIKCAFLHGYASRGLEKCQAAVTYYGMALQLLRSLSRDGEPADKAFELEVLVNLATYEMFLARYESCERHLDEARRQIAGAPQSREQAGHIEWVQALLHRWRGEPELALRHAMASADVLAEAGTPASFGRIQAIVADIAIDLAQSFAPDLPSDARGAFVTLASPYAERAVEAARSANDPTGRALALLASARCCRAAGLNVDNLPTIEASARLARRRGDAALLGQTFTALGDDLASRGEADQALSAYRRALDALEGCDAVALGVYPRRALLRAAEMRGDL